MARVTVPAQGTFLVLYILLDRFSTSNLEFPEAPIKSKIKKKVKCTRTAEQRGRPEGHGTDTLHGGGRPKRTSQAGRRPKTLTRKGRQRPPQRRVPRRKKRRPHKKFRQLAVAP